MNDIYIESGRRIKKIREEKKYTREYIAIKADISEKFLYEIELGMKGFSANTLYKIAKALEVSSEYILNGNSCDSDNMELNMLLNTFSPDELKTLHNVLKMLIKLKE